MLPSFLHLEDIKNKAQLGKLWDGTREVDTSDGILPLLHDFYQHLYKTSNNKTTTEIGTFLDTLECLPHINNFEKLIGDITYKEIEAAIGQLSTGKSPGFDGITAEFYKHFKELISPILECVFKSIFDQRGLSFSQHLVIIILLFKKG